MIEDGWPTEYFHDAISEEDARIIGITRGESSAQQAAESLGSLVALRVWSPRWKKERINLAVKQDSVSALAILLKCKTAGEAPSAIAREVALDMAESIYLPDGPACAWRF